MKDDAVPIPISIGLVQKFNYNGDYDQLADLDTLKIIDPTTQEVSYDLSKMPNPTFTDGVCDNFPLEVHLKIGFAPLSTTIAGN